MPMHTFLKNLKPHFGEHTQITAKEAKVMRTSNSFGSTGIVNVSKGATMKTTVLAIIFAITTLNLACDPSETLAKPGSAGGSTGSSQFCTPGIGVAGNQTCHTQAGALGTLVCNAQGTDYDCAQTGCIPKTTTSACNVSGSSGILTCDDNGENFTCVANAIPTGGTTSTGGNTSAGGSTASSSSPNTTCDAAHVNQLLPGTTNIVCLPANGGYGWTLVNTGGTTAPATSAAGGNTAVSTSTSVSGNGICDANHINQTFNGMVCVKDTIDVYKWVLINTGGNGGSVPTGGTVATGGSTASTGSTSTGPTYPVCWFESQHPSTLVCSSRWVPNQPTYADLMVWESPQGTLILTTAISSDGNYRWSLAGYLIGYYRVWYTCAGCGTLPSSGANYGANASNVAQISSDSMKWLGCPSPGYDIEFNMKLDGTLVPAGCGT